jgi:tetratricopeptide (TPR) repeat protein
MDSSESSATAAKPALYRTMPEESIYSRGNGQRRPSSSASQRVGAFVGRWYDRVPARRKEVTRVSELRIETWSMPGADLGPDNPLPPLRITRDLHSVDPGAVGIPDDMLRNMAYGHVATILPYTMQDGYNRQRVRRDFRVAVLENELLRATFLLELGGRLCSLFHKPSGRELLSVNPVFQPANLAIRNAWFSGGVEWNIGMIGHSPLTCSPVFASRVERADGTPVLRLYEWERIRRVPFQIDACLPPGAPMLLVLVRIINPHDHDIPMYWWSNMAVPETPDTRVIAPADSAYSYGYKEDGLRVIPVPHHAGQDITYPTRSQRAIDYFFHVPDERRPWITALDGQGRGLIQVSTPRLKGRKLFLWGTGTGGRNWQEWLSEPGHPYIEIQAGLARTQLEHLPMPAQTEWAWLEGYGLMEADPARTHGQDWRAAQRQVEDRLEQIAPRAEFEAAFNSARAYADHPPQELLHRGSGWGALERLRRERAGEPPFCSAGLVFDAESLGEPQAPWLHLLRNARFPDRDPESDPGGYMVQPEWQRLLEASLDNASGWLPWLHLGVMRRYAGDQEGARRAWEQSLERQRSAWALRNLAVLALENRQFDDAIRLYAEAHGLLPSLRPLTIELGQALLMADRPQDWLDIADGLAEPDQSSGRIRLLEAQAALAQQDFDRAERILSAPLVVDDMREGELSLAQLWFDLHARRLSAIEGVPIDDALRARARREFPLPKALDFRMQES